jgi:hypothetical protein
LAETYLFPFNTLLIYSLFTYLPSLLLFTTTYIYKEGLGRAWRGLEGLGGGLA